MASEWPDDYVPRQLGRTLWELRPYLFEGFFPSECTIGCGSSACGSNSRTVFAVPSFVVDKPEVAGEIGILAAVFLGLLALGAYTGVTARAPIARTMEREVGETAATARWRRRSEPGIDRMGTKPRRSYAGPVTESPGTSITTLVAQPVTQ